MHWREDCICSRSITTYVLSILIILGIVNAVSQQITHIISVNARELDVKVSSEDFWKTFGSLLKPSVNGTIDDDK
jgi:hypothetical protein